MISDITDTTRCSRRLTFTSCKPNDESPVALPSQPKVEAVLVMLLLLLPPPPLLLLLLEGGNLSSVAQ